MEMGHAESYHVLCDISFFFTMYRWIGIITIFLISLWFYSETFYSIYFYQLFLIWFLIIILDIC